MHFEGRELKTFAEPVEAATLQEGTVYFAVNFVDDEMLLPTMEPVVFVGRNLEQADSDRVYFQDAESFRRGVRHSSTSRDAEATFYSGAETQMGHIFDSERGLDVLLRCSLRRAAHADRT